MATAVVTTTVNSFPNGLDNTLDHLNVFGTFSVGAGTYITNGLPVTFTNPDVLSEYTPFFGEVYSPGSGYAYFFDPVNQTLRIFEGGAAVSTPMAELANAVNIPAGVTGDTIYFKVTLNRG